MLRNVFYKPRLLSTLASGALLVFLMLPLFASAQVGAAIERGLAEVLWSVVTTVFGWMVGIGGGLLDSAVTNYVVGFGELYRTSGLGFSIDSLWSTVRDIFNLTFIFGLVYIGFKMIFNSGDSSAKRMLGSLVLAALLVNFSLFITKMIIDFSNLAAAQFALAFSTSPGVYSVSSGFMQLFGLTRGFDALPEGAGFTYIFGMLFLFLIAAFVFAAGGLLLIIRFVVLNFYMILSPLMFLGMVFPGMRGVSSKYWEGFLSRAFFAPAYLLMLYFAHQVLVNMQGVATAGNANLASAFSNEGATRYDAATSIIPFFIIIGAFLIASLVVAQKMGAEGATNAIAVGKRLSGGARKYAQRKSGDVTFGAAGAAGRNTVGRVANRAANSDTLNRWAAKSSIAASGLKASSALADSSFDGRRVAGLGKSFGIGEGSKSGYASNIKAKQKADAEFAKGLSENKIVRGVDGKIVDDKDGKIQAQLD